MVVGLTVSATAVRKNARNFGKGERKTRPAPGIHDTGTVIRSIDKVETDFIIYQSYRDKQANPAECRSTEP